MDPRYVKRQSTMVEQIGEPPSRLLNAPTLYCTFIMGVTFICVGTFLSALSFLSDDEDDNDEETISSFTIYTFNIFKIIGPLILVIGVLCLFGMSILCFVAYRTNKDLIRRIGFPMNRGSTFYRGSELIPNDQLHEVTTSTQGGGVELLPVGVNYDSTEEPYRFLANTVAMERTRNLSKKYKDKNSDSNRETLPRTFSEVSFLNKSNQVVPYSPQNTEIEFDGIDRNEDVMRDRSFTLSSRPVFIQKEGLLKRNASLTPSRSELKKQESTRRQVLRKMTSATQMNEFPPELEEAFGDFGEQRTRKKSKNEGKPESHLYKLPSCSPQIIESMLGISPPSEGDISFQRSVSFEHPITQVQSNSSKGQPWYPPPSSTMEKNQRNTHLDEHLSSQEVQNYYGPEKEIPRKISITSIPSSRTRDNKSRRPNRSKKLRKRNERPRPDKRSQDSSSVPSSSSSSNEEEPPERRASLETIIPPSPVQAKTDVSSILNNLLTSSNSDLEKSGLQREHKALSIIHSDGSYVE